MLIDRDNWRHHRRWVILVLILLIAATGWYGVESMAIASWPGGSSLPGFVFGVVGGLIILFEMFLWFRKKVRVWRIGRAQTWMAAHIWLGLLCLPLLIYHSGFRFGGTLSTVLMVLLIIVIASGVWGLVMQQFLPKRMLDELPAETIYSQIEYLTEQLTSEAEQVVRATCGPDPDDNGRQVEQAEPVGAAHMVVGAVRTVGLVQGKVLQSWVPPTPVPHAESLRTFFRVTIAPFLREGTACSTRLRDQRGMTAIFQDLKTQLPPAAHASADALERMCSQRRQWDQQIRLHYWLHNWLWVHFPLSVALVVLMVVHIWVALKYW